MHILYARLKEFLIYEFFNCGDFHSGDGYGEHLGYSGDGYGEGPSGRGYGDGFGYATAFGNGRGYGERIEPKIILIFEEK